MHLNWFIIRAVPNCHYKAWLLYKQQETTKQSIAYPDRKINTNDKLAITAMQLWQEEQTEPAEKIEITSGKARLKPTKKAEKLLIDRVITEAGELVSTGKFIIQK